MATISPVTSVVDGVPRLTWSSMTTGDTITRFTVAEQWGLAGCVQFVFSSGTPTVSLEMSNDGVNWTTLKDLQGTTISTATAGLFEFTCSAAYIRPAISTAGTATAIIVMRGLY